MYKDILVLNVSIHPLNAGLNPICHLLALLGGATIAVVSRLRDKDDILELFLIKFCVIRGIVGRRGAVRPTRTAAKGSMITITLNLMRQKLDLSINNRTF
jgi:hypothetical protein